MLISTCIRGGHYMPNHCAPFEGLYILVLRLLTFRNLAHWNWSKATGKFISKCHRSNGGLYFVITGRDRCQSSALHSKATRHLGSPKGRGSLLVSADHAWFHATCILQQTKGWKHLAKSRSNQELKTLHRKSRHSRIRSQSGLCKVLGSTTYKRQGIRVWNIYLPVTSQHNCLGLVSSYKNCRVISLEMIITDSKNIVAPSSVLKNRRL